MSDNSINLPASLFEDWVTPEHDKKIREYFDSLKGETVTFEATFDPPYKRTKKRITRFIEAN